MTGNLGSITPTTESELLQAVKTVRDHAAGFAGLPVKGRIELLRATLHGVHRVASRWVAAACKAKGIDEGSPLSGEEWLAGPVITLRGLRTLIDSLEEIAAHGRPKLGASAQRRSDGRLAVQTFPTSTLDAALFSGFTCHTFLEAGLDEEGARARQAEFYQRGEEGQAKEGRVSVILGAGNVASIPPLDTVYKMFVEGFGAILKMNPVNEYLGPFLAEAMAPLIQAGYLRIVYGGGEVGGMLVKHPLVDDVHITGSDVTHDLIVWGPPGPERERRKRENDPLLKKTISSELGNVSPIVIVPLPYSQKELWFQARNAASMVQNNGSFNCNAGKVLVTSAGWPQRQAFMDLLRKALSAMPLRTAYYPGAQGRYDSLLAGRERVERFGTPQPGKGELSWALVPDLPSSDAEERLFQVEPFCGILSETALPEVDPATFLDAATRFCNDRLWGTLNACIIMPQKRADGALSQALDRSIQALRYGSVAVNHWPALVYGFTTPPWGGHPSATLANIQSGLGWVHNSFMLSGIEKSVVVGPITVSPKPAWFFDNKKTHQIGRRMVDMEAAPSWLKLPGMVGNALLG